MDRSCMRGVGVGTARQDRLSAFFFLRGITHKVVEDRS